MDKDKCYANGEGYPDRTSGEAIRQSENKEGGRGYGKEKELQAYH